MKLNQENSKAPRQLLALLITFALAVCIGALILYPNKSLPVLHPADLNPALVDARDWSRSQHNITSFDLINHHGENIQLDDVLGQVLIVDFFFTRCATICPIMTSNLTKVRDAFHGKAGWRILSHSVTPKADSASVLAAYAKRMNAEHPNWWFLTGEKKEVYRLARRSYFACYDEASGGDGGLQDFVHTENVVLVDQQGRLRGFYDGTSESSINQLIEDCDWLLQEKN
ncbi:SCO family protein [Flavobacteriales bacterium]|nr:SCO family protein [Flavobacteriales bacterium]